jgi:hypothetical protein
MHTASRQTNAHTTSARKGPWNHGSLINADVTRCDVALGLTGTARDAAAPYASTHKRCHCNRTQYQTLPGAALLVGVPDFAKLGLDLPPTPAATPSTADAGRCLQSHAHDTSAYARTVACARTRIAQEEARYVMQQ